MTHQPAAALPFILGSVGTAIAAQVSMKSAMNRVGRVDRHTPRSRWLPGVPRLALGLCMYGISTVLWLTALSRVELSYAFPFVSLSFIGIVVSARLAFGEPATMARLLGSGMIVVGVLLVSLSG